MKPRTATEIPIISDPRPPAVDRESALTNGRGCPQPPQKALAGSAVLPHFEQNIPPGEVYQSLADEPPPGPYQKASMETNKSNVGKEAAELSQSEAI
jgi:hypothetical protein